MSCIDDSSRIAFLKAAVGYNESLGITVKRVIADNSFCYIAKDFAKACKALGLKHICTKPYTPKTNCKAERFIQTDLWEWAYALAYPSSDHRKAHLPRWNQMYNWHRPPRHSKIKNADQSPRSKPGQPIEAPHLVARRPAHARGLRPFGCRS